MFKCEKCFYTFENPSYIKERVGEYQRIDVFTEYSCCPNCKYDEYVEVSNDICPKCRKHNYQVFRKLYDSYTVEEQEILIEDMLKYWGVE